MGQVGGKSRLEQIGWVEGAKWPALELGWEIQVPAFLPRPKIISLPEWIIPEHPRFWVHHSMSLRFSLPPHRWGPGSSESEGFFLHTWGQGCQPTRGAQVPIFTGWRTKGSSQKRGEGSSYLHILRVVGLRGPVWDLPHATLSIAKLLTEGPVLWLGVPAAVGVVEGDIEEERPADGGTGLSVEVKVRWLTHHLASTLGSLILWEGTPLSFAYSPTTESLPVIHTASVSPCPLFF